MDESAVHASLETVKLLHELGADIEQTSRWEWNGMLRAAVCGNTEIIKYLNDQNSQLIHAEDDGGETAFTIACEHANLETVKLLHELGADINHIDKFKRTGLMRAASKGKTEIIDYIISKCPKQIHAIDKYNNSAFTLAKDFSTILFILESFFNSSQDRRNHETSVVTGVGILPSLVEAMAISGNGNRGNVAGNVFSKSNIFYFAFFTH